MHSEDGMAPSRFCLVSGWEVLVEERQSGEWTVHVGCRTSGEPGYFTRGAQVPGGPFPTRYAAGAAGIGYAEEQKRLGVE